MNLLRLYAGIAWVIVMFVTVRAIQQLGVDGANIFFDDFVQPWRAQFNTDFFAHLFLMALWIFYRETRWWSGAICAVFAVLLGGAFSLAYILIAICCANGDMRKLLLGRHA